mmetsp:Transcript_27137/g.108675  ORF Transcript_27137/g.108675 Transcript_27137/m.108675 type:complete len:344 (-) Transcript_27137:84-1115(-)
MLQGSSNHRLLLLLKVARLELEIEADPLGEHRREGREEDAARDVVEERVHGEARDPRRGLDILEQFRRQLEDRERRQELGLLGVEPRRIVVVVVAAAAVSRLRSAPRRASWSIVPRPQRGRRPAVRRPLGGRRARRGDQALVEPLQPQVDVDHLDVERRVVRVARVDPRPESREGDDVRRQHEPRREELQVRRAPREAAAVSSGRRGVVAGNNNVVVVASVPVAKVQREHCERQRCARVEGRRADRVGVALVGEVGEVAAPRAEREPALELLDLAQREVRDAPVARAARGRRRGVELGVPQARTVRAVGAPQPLDGDVRPEPRARRRRRADAEDGELDDDGTS